MKLDKKEMIAYLKRKARDTEEGACKIRAENTQLKELNREMVGMLKDITYYELPCDVYATISELLAKAEEGEGE